MGLMEVTITIRLRWQLGAVTLWVLNMVIMKNMLVCLRSTSSRSPTGRAEFCLAHIQNMMLDSWSEANQRRFRTRS